VAAGEYGDCNGRARGVKRDWKFEIDKRLPCYNAIVNHQFSERDVIHYENPLFF
jgi:hypothetical protein